MTKMTVSVPEELLSRLRKKFPDINWAEVVRRGILQKLQQLEKLRARGEV